MNGDPFAPVRPGQEAIDRLTSSAWMNLVTEGGLAYRRHGSGFRHMPEPSPLRPGEILVRNETGADRNQYDIVAFEEPVFTRDDNTYEFQERTLFKAIEPDAIDHFYSWGVLLEPLRENAIGRCLLQGITVAKVNFANAAALVAHKYATVIDATYGNLESTFCGQARILWRNPTADSGTIYWCKLLVNVPTITQLRGVLDGDLAEGGSATVSIYIHNGSAWVDTTANVTAYDDLLETAGSLPSTTVVNVYFNSGRWWVQEARCSA